MQIVIDADACPVVDIIIEETNMAAIPVMLVKSYSHFSMKEYPKHVSIKYIDDGADAVDYKIVGMVNKDDIVVTQDYGLAALCLQKDCKVLHHVGFSYSKKKIDQMLQERHQSAKARKAGFKTKGPKKLSDEQKNSFRLHLRKLLSS